MLNSSSSATLSWWYRIVNRIRSQFSTTSPFNMTDIDIDIDNDDDDSYCDPYASTRPHTRTRAVLYPNRILSPSYPPPPMTMTMTKLQPTTLYEPVTTTSRVWDDDALSPPSTSNGVISVTPASLKFPHDDPREHVKRIAIWNRTTHFVAFRVDAPESDHFEVSCDTTGIYGGAEADLIVRCRPRDERMYSDQLTIYITNMTDGADPITIPIEIVPSIAWFDEFDGHKRMRYLRMPHAVLGQSVKYPIEFPHPPDALPPYNFYVIGDKHSEVEISPTKGRIGPGLADKLMITYSPKTYTSIAYKFAVHFPELATRPYTMTVFMRCAPGLERALIEEQVRTELEEKQWQLWNLKRAEANAKLWKNRDVCTRGSRKHFRPIEPPSEPDDSGKFDLCTPGGIQKFMIQPPGKVAWPQEELGPLGLTLYEMERIYKQMEKEFHDKYVRIGIQQRNLVTQPTKLVVGERLIETQPEKLAEMVREKELHMLEYQKALGMLDNSPEDMTRKNLKLTRQQVVRDAGVNYKELLAAGQEAESGPNSGMWQEADDDRSLVRYFILRPFIQLVLLIITRQRADKRIAKLRLLMQETLQAKERETARGGTGISGLGLDEDEGLGEVDGGFRSSTTKELRTRRKSNPTKQSHRKSTDGNGNLGELTGEGPKLSKGSARTGKEKRKDKEKSTDSLKTGVGILRQDFMTPAMRQDEAARTVGSNLGINQDILPAPPPPPPSPHQEKQLKSKSKKMSSASKKSGKSQRKAAGVTNK